MRGMGEGVGKYTLLFGWGAGGRQPNSLINRADVVGEEAGWGESVQIMEAFFGV